MPVSSGDHHDMILPPGVLAHEESCVWDDL